ncbi:hypothetical protein ACFFQF_33760 [Haladaptatus pallidirubidus]|uniref:hypothetical protein n=1 Tax=Haladaptatus pallidirubidus TaxID=1008152 RepID=UPI0035E92A9E
MGPTSKACRTNALSPSPNAGQATAADFPSDYRDVLSIVLAYVAERIETLWS